MFDRKKHFNCPKAKEHNKDPKKNPPCPKAHNPLELELNPVSKKIENLNAVMRVSKEQIKDNKALEAWIPANSKRKDDIACF